MRLLRTLANLGATVLVLHHTGKADSAKLYRGSSDIKAAVDTAYVLESEEPGQLAKLRLTCFKGRLTPGKNYALEFRKRQGFVACRYIPSKQRVEDVVTEILEATPRINQKEIIRQARERGCSKGQIESCMKTGNWKTEAGPNNSILYSLLNPKTGDEDGKP
jgi:hypothetical protein